MPLINFVVVFILMYSAAGIDYEYHNSPPYYFLDDKVSVENVKFVAEEEESVNVQEIQNRCDGIDIHLVFIKSDGSKVQVLIEHGKKVYVKLSCFAIPKKPYIMMSSGIPIENPPDIHYYSEVLRNALKRYDTTTRYQVNQIGGMSASFKTGEWVSFVFK